ncbi:DUF7144 family membrane protein [Streptomyces sp. NPDC002402]
MSLRHAYGLSASLTARTRASLKEAGRTIGKPSEYLGTLPVNGHVTSRHWAARALHRGEWHVAQSVKGTPGHVQLYIGRHRCGDLAVKGVPGVATRNLFEFDLTGWGWIHLIMGEVITLAGFALFQGAT